MSLVKRNVPINLSGGLDTKTDEKHVVPGKLTTLRNGRFEKVGRIDKTYGYDLLGDKDVTGAALGVGTSLAVFNSELLQYNSEKVYSYLPSLDRWISKGSFVACNATTRLVVKNTLEQVEADSAVLGGIGVYAWEQTTSPGSGTVDHLAYSVFDESGEVPIVSNAVLNTGKSDYQYVRCAAFKQYIFVFFYASGSLWAVRINPLAPTTLPAAIEIADDINQTNPCYDVYNYRDNRFLIVYNVEGASEINGLWMDDTGAEVTSGALASFTIGNAGTDCLSIVLGPNATFYILFYNSSDKYMCTIRTPTGLESVAPFQVDSTGTTVTNCHGYQTSTGITTVYNVGSTIKKATISTAGTPGTPAYFASNVRLFSKMFAVTNDDGDETYYVCVSNNSTLQPHYFVMRSDSLLVAKMQPTLAGGYRTEPILANVSRESASIFSWAILKKSLIVSDNGNVTTPTGVAKTKLDFTNEDIFISKQIGNALLITGGFLSMYDGQAISEHGFHLYPEISALEASSGSLTNGTYTMCAVYSWVDSFGQVYRSRPSVATSVTTSGGSKKIVVTYSLPFQTAKSNVVVEIYCTDVGGDVLYKKTQIVASSTPSATLTATYEITSVAGITANEILYTSGGVLPNVAPPACAAIDVFQNRVFLAGLEEENIWFSKETKLGQAIEFTDEFTKAIEANGGRTTCLGVIDDKLIAFKKSRYYFTYGDGPNATNTLGGFAEFQGITIDVGAVNARSAERISRGLIIKSSKGLYGIDSSLTASYIGAEVEEFNDKTVRAISLLPDTNEVRIATSDGDIISLNTFFQQWATASNLAANDALVYDGAYTVLRTDGKIFRENADKFRIGSASYGMTLVTGWLPLTGIAGFQRVYRMLFVGKYKSPHKLRVSVAYDYVNAWIHSEVFDPAQDLPTSVYGDDATYGVEGSVYGGEENGYLIRVDMERQKCTAIRFKIEEVITTATAGTQESLSISDISLVVGAKKGFGKFKQSKIMGVS